MERSINQKKEKGNDWQKCMPAAEIMLAEGENDPRVLLARLLNQLGEMEERIQSLEKLYICQKDVLNIDEATEYLNISRSWLYKLTSTHQIPFYKPNGRFLYFERAELDKWIRSALVRSENQLNDQVNTYTMSNPLRA